MNEENEYCIRVKGTNMVVIGFVDGKPSKWTIPQTLYYITH